MATAIEDAGAAKPKDSGGSLLNVVIAVVVLSLVAIGGGGFLGLQLYGMVEQSVQRKMEAEASKRQEAIKPGVANAVVIKTLNPVITNLAEPANSWVRLEASIVLEGEDGSDADLLAAKITEDIVALLRTVTLVQIQGAGGFQSLREDLSDRIKTRSNGRVGELIIHTFVVE